MREGIADGVTAPRIVAERALAQTERLDRGGRRRTHPSSHPSPPRTPTRALRLARRGRGPPPAGARAVPRRASATTSRHATETIGLADLPGGDAMYAAQILSWTTLELDAQRGPRARRRRPREDPGRAARARPRSWATPTPPTAEAAIAAGFGVPVHVPDQLKATAEEQVRRSWDAGAVVVRHGSRAPTARSGSSRSSARPTCRSRSTTSRPRTGPGRACTT